MLIKNIVPQTKKADKDVDDFNFGRIRSEKNSECPYSDQFERQICNI